MNIGMLGHVDHGKTTLTKALTGKWTDTHSEELKRGISIRLGYADARIYVCEKCGKYSPTEKCSCGGKAKLKRKISIVDAPGHETLMTTVISAASILNGALFLIAANEKCPQPQTSEHMLLLDAIGIKNIIVVQTKIDLVSKERALESYNEIKQFLKGTVAEGAPIIPVAANYGINIDKLLEEIDKRMPAPEYNEKAELRMYVSRSFDVNKPGTKISKLNGGVLGGSIVQGVLKIGDEIEIKPGVSKPDGKLKPLTCKVNSLMEESEKLKSAHPGGLIAIGTDLDPAITKSDNLVGCVVGRVGKVPDPTYFIKAKYKFMERKEFENQPFRKEELVVVNVHTATSVGYVVKHNKNEVEIKLKKPVVVYDGMNVAISRRGGHRWRLAAWGTISK